jgi:hypothetical protein
LGTARLLAKHYGKPDIAAIDINLSTLPSDILSLSLSQWHRVLNLHHPWAPSESGISFRAQEVLHTRRLVLILTALQAIQEMRFISLETSALAYQNSLSSIEYIVLCGDRENML